MLTSLKWIEMHVIISVTGFRNIFDKCQHLFSTMQLFVKVVENHRYAFYNMANDTLDLLFGKTIRFVYLLLYLNMSYTLKLSHYS